MTSTDEPSAAESLRNDGPTYFCNFCFNNIDPDDEDTFKQVTSWVSGPKLDGPKMREQTGRLAHKSCIDLLSKGQDPLEQPRLFEEAEPPPEEPYDPSKNYDF